MTNAMPFDPWRADPYSGGYIGVFLPEGETVWRYVRENKRPKVFATGREAKDAARTRWFERLRGKHGADMRPLTEKEAAEALGVEEWLRSKRADQKAAYVERKAGKRPVVVMAGRAR